MKPEWKRSLGTSRRRWESNVKMNVKEIVCKGVDSIQLAQNTVQWRALVNMTVNLQIPKKAGDFLNSQSTTSFSRTLFHGVSI